MNDEFNAYMRQQIYVESVKADEANKFDETQLEIELTIALIASMITVENMAELTKSQLAAIVAKLNARLSKLFNKTITVTTRAVYNFMRVDTQVTKSIASWLTGKAKSRFPVGLQRLWAVINNAPIGGTGQEPKNMLRTFFSSAGSKIVSRLKQGYANGWTPREFVLNTIGSSNYQYRNGIMLTIKNQFKAMINTWMQHVSSHVSAAVNSIFYDRYQWCSTMDERTSPICVELDGTIYEYGKGPLPPAHYRCRSKTMPLAAESSLPTPSFKVWVNDQPEEVKRDIKKYANYPPRGDGEKLTVRPMSLDEYGSKVNMILSNIPKKG